MAADKQKAGFSAYKSLKTILTIFYGWIVGVNKLAFNKLNRQRGFPYKREQQLSMDWHIKVKKKKKKLQFYYFTKNSLRGNIFHIYNRNLNNEATMN